MNTFKVIVAGGRHFNDYKLVESKLDFILQNKTNIKIVSGACDTGTLTYNRPDGTSVCGADGLGEKYAAKRGYAVTYFPANWDLHGREAGPIRNGEMAVYVGPAGGLVAFWDGKSKGTSDMIKKAKDNGLKSKVYNY